jgi:hypothetical protein
LSGEIKDGLLMTHKKDLHAPGLTASEIMESSVQPAESLSLLPLTGKWRMTRDRDNTLVLNDWELDIPALDLRKRVRPMPVANQLAEIKGELTYPLNLVYRCRVGVRFLPPEIRFLVDEDGLIGEGEYVVNQIRLDPKDFLRCRQFDLANRALDLRPCLHPGENEFEVRLTVFHEGQGLVDAPKLYGDFELERAGGEYEIVPARSVHTLRPLAEEGCPFYCGAVTYQRDFEFSAAAIEAGIFLDPLPYWKGFKDVMRVCVGGREVAVRPWPPYRVSLTPFLLPGKNEIEIQFTGTLEGIL